MHANTVGLKAVMADGTIIDQMQMFRKDLSGHPFYDMKQLLIGAEGTLVRSIFINYVI
jgi:FAD/FMN-containing dehydrogenase